MYEETAIKNETLIRLRVHQKSVHRHFGKNTMMYAWIRVTSVKLKSDSNQILIRLVSDCIPSYIYKHRHILSFLVIRISNVISEMQFEMVILMQIC